jgi:hypothetical protein
MKSHAAICGLSLVFASVTCLQGYIRWDPFVLRAQSLDMSPLDLCQHNKMLPPAKLPQCPVSQFEIPATTWLPKMRIANQTVPWLQDSQVVLNPHYHYNWSHDSCSSGLAQSQPLQTTCPGLGTIPVRHGSVNCLFTSCSHSGLVGLGGKHFPQWLNRKIMIGAKWGLHLVLT